MQIEKFSVGSATVRQRGQAQLRAMQQAEQAGVVIVPVWNKSFREHSLIGTKPDDVRAEADAAVQARRLEAQLLRRRRPHRRQDRRRLPGRQRLLHLDVADFIAPGARRGRAGGVRARHGVVRRYIGSRPSTASSPPATSSPSTSPTSSARRPTDARSPPSCATWRRSGDAAHPRRRRRLRRHRRRAGEDRAQLPLRGQEAGRSTATSSPPRGSGTSSPRSRPTRRTSRSCPFELFFILGALAREKIPVQTIAPKFSGKFLKGIDYVGDMAHLRARVRRRPGGGQARASACSACRRRSRSASTPAATSSRSTRSSTAPSPEARRRAAPQDRRHHLARGGDRRRALRARAGLAIAKEIYLDGAPALRRALQAVRDGRGDRSRLAADRRRRVDALDRRGLREPPAPRPVVPRLRRPPAPARPRRLPGRRRDGRRVDLARSSPRARSPGAA